MSTRVVNKYRDSYDIYIGRGSRWGNPFVIGRDGDRDTVIAKYRDYLTHQVQTGKITHDDLRTLKGFTLGCFCKPQACHGDVLVEFIDTLCND